VTEYPINVGVRCPTCGELEYYGVIGSRARRLQTQSSCACTKTSKHEAVVRRLAFAEARRVKEGRVTQ